MFQILRRSLLCLLCVWALNSCAPAVKQMPAPVTAVVSEAADYPADLKGARLYRIAPEQSQLHILVYRAGRLAQLGHNHVLSSGTLSGYVWLHDSLSRSGFSLLLPVNELIVDDPQARITEGADFPPAVPDEDRAGTRRNMLKPEQLDGEQYPIIRLRSLSIEGTRETPEVRVQVVIKDQVRELAVPVNVAATPQLLRASGQFDVRLTEFGIKPFSVLMGALQVQDQLAIKFDLVALPVH
ncbi:MAG: YceI family protein [Steroidobacteraceae bacterium]